MSNKAALGRMTQDQLAESLGIAIAQYVAPLRKRIDELEARPTPTWAGPYQQGRAYAALSFVVHSGSLWISKCSTVLKPGGNDDWQLCTKRGKVEP